MQHQGNLGQGTVCREPREAERLIPGRAREEYSGGRDRPAYRTETTLLADYIRRAGTNCSLGSRERIIEQIWVPRPPVVSGQRLGSYYIV